MAQLRPSLLIPTLLIAGLAVVGGTIKLAHGSVQVMSPDRLCSQPPANMPEEKLRLLLEKCQHELPKAAVVARPSEPGSPPPEVVNRPKEKPVVTMGIQERGPWPTWAKDQYFFKNTWSDAQLLIYAGSTTDLEQGVVVVADRFAKPQPQKLAEYLTQTKDGPLRFVAENGKVLTLVAQNGTTYTFNVTARSLTRN